VENRIKPFLTTKSESPAARCEKLFESQTREAHRWLELFERQVRERPRLYLGAAFGLGIVVAWYIKRK
jgi:hypothetical protein